MGLFDDAHTLSPEVAEQFRVANATTEARRESYQQIKGTLNRRQQRVLQCLKSYPEARGGDPTAYELLRYMVAQGLARDVNDVRPRLTELKAKGDVYESGKRRCSVTGHGAATWSVG